MKIEEKIILITGATGGIGKQTAISLAASGFRVYITGRNKESGNNAVNEIQEESGNKNVYLLTGDLSTFEGILSVAEQFKNRRQKLDILINNAGSAAPKLIKTENDLELNFAVNVVAPFLLTKLLMPDLKKSSSPRVVCVTGGDLPSKLEIDNLQCEKEFKGLNSYSQSKSAMMALMYKFSQQIKDENITINICYPGQAGTNMTQSVTKEMLPVFFRPLFPVFKLFTKPDNGKSAKIASKSSVFLATSDTMNNITGKYFNKKCKETTMPKCVTDENTGKFVWNYVNKILLDKKLIDS